MGLNLIDDLVIWRRSISGVPRCDSYHAELSALVGYWETTIAFPMALVGLKS